MQEFIAYLVKNLVKNPNDVVVTVAEGETKILVEIRVSPEDIARVVGKKGRTINAIRTIAFTLGAKLERQVRIEVLN